MVLCYSFQVNVYAGRRLKTGTITVLGVYERATDHELGCTGQIVIEIRNSDNRDTCKTLEQVAQLSQRDRATP